MNSNIFKLFLRHYPQLSSEIKYEIKSEGEDY